MQFTNSRFVFHPTAAAGGYRLNPSDEPRDVYTAGRVGEIDGT